MVIPCVSEVSSTVSSQFHNLYPAANKTTPTYPGPKSGGGLQSAISPPDSTYSAKEAALCGGGAPYSPYYNPCVDKSLRAHYQTALT